LEGRDKSERVFECEEWNFIQRKLGEKKYIIIVQDLDK
jgi:hypothetical protein